MLQRATMPKRFQESPAAGQDLRAKPGRWERATNAQQRKLVRAYDSWAVATRRELSIASARLASPAELQAIVARRLPLLEKAMLEITGRGIIGAANLVAGRGQMPLGIQALIVRQAAENAKLVSQSLIPHIQNQLNESINRGAMSDPKALRESFVSLRNRPAQYAGGYWTMIFETERELGRADERQRATQGEAPRPVRWVLDPLAEHCEGGPGFYGCRELAGEYPNWDALPTVPAGQVQCRGNCKCSLEVLVDGQWRRGLGT